MFRHADFVGDDGGDLVAAGFEGVGHPLQELAAIGTRPLRPIRERGLRRADGAVDVVGVAGGDGREPFLGGGVDHVQRAAPGRLDPRAVDVQTCVFVHDVGG